MEVLRQHSSSATIYFPLIDAGKNDFESTPVTFVAGDTQKSEDGGAFVNTTNNPVHEGNGIYSLVVTAAELGGAYTVITVIDQTNPKTWEDQAIIIQTVGSSISDLSFELHQTQPETRLTRIGVNPNADLDAARSLEYFGGEETQVDDATPTTTEFDGPTTLSSVDGYYNGMLVVFGTDTSLEHIARKVSEYTGATRTLKFSEPWPVAPSNGNAFCILPLSSPDSGGAVGAS